MRKKYNTPHRNRVVKTRLTDKEYEQFTKYHTSLQMSQSQFIRLAITHLNVHPVIRVSCADDQLLADVGRLIAEYGKIGSNLNQIARHLNEYGTPYAELALEVRNVVADLADLKFELLQKVGDAVGDVQTYQL